MAQHVTYCHLIPMISWYSWLALAIPGSYNYYFLANSLEKNTPETTVVYYSQTCL